MSNYSQLSVFSKYVGDHRKLSKDTTKYQRSLFDRRARRGDLRSSVNKLDDFFQNLYWETERDESYNEFTSRRNIGIEDGKDFTSEVMSEMYSYRDLSDIDRPEKWALEAHNLISSLDEFQVLREFTKGDADCSALATSKFIDQLSKEIAALREVIQDAEDYDGYGGGGGNGNGDGDGDGGGGDGSGKIDRQKELQDKRKSIERKLTYKASRVCDNLTKEVAEIKETLNDIEQGSGGDGDGGDGWGDAKTDKQLNEKDERRWDLVKKLSEEEIFRKILKLAGRLKRIGEGLPRESEEIDEEIVGIELGNTIDKILTEDLALINHDVMKMMFWADFAEETCYQYKMRGTEPQARGPFVIMLDTSGSMGGKPNQLGRAIGTAYMLKAKQENRSCDVLNFNSWVCGHYRVKNGVSCEVIRDREYPTEWLRLIDENINIRAGGGTCFNTVFNHAFDHTDALKDDKGDIIFVTDDGARVNEAVMKRIKDFKDRGGRIFTYLINGGWCSPQLSSISEIVINLDALGESEQLKALAEPMRKV